MNRGLATCVGYQAALKKGSNLISMDDWLNEETNAITTSLETHGTHRLSPLAENLNMVHTSKPTGVRTVPYSSATFQLLSSRLRVHESIARTISHSDVATFTADEIYMHNRAFGDCPNFE